ncbi:sugar phosphate isomerase/epimerase [Clostridia bacterium]|nr:sugar phosphate isomerase/epimerase [Clostridia bacterium]
MIKLGVFDVLFRDLTWEQTLDRVADAGLEAIELGVGAYSQSSHVCVPDLLDRAEARKEFLGGLERRGLFISALSAQGNPVHPNTAIAADHHARFEQAVRLAAQLGVETILLLSGCPGGAPGDNMPNWITCPWPDEYLQAYTYQWEEVLIPYWQKAVVFAQDHGIRRLGLEMHPGMAVYNPETLLRLREACGPAIGCNLDPSHLVWQGIDLSEAIYVLRDCIYHVHMKDTALNDRHIRLNGPLSARHYRHYNERPWTFRSIGYGQSQQFWIAFLQSLQWIEFDGVLSIEHEDAMLSRDEGFARAVTFLQSIRPGEPIRQMWWA